MDKNLFTWHQEQTINSSIQFIDGGRRFADDWQQVRMSLARQLIISYYNYKQKTS